MADQSDSKSSSDETDRSDQNDDLGSGRSYGCTFCKRGFTTAQALGGHMNIHRKDRGKPIKPDYTASHHHHHHHHHNSLVSSKLVVTENYASFRSFLAIQSYPPVHFAGAPHDHQQVHLDYRQTYNNFNLTNSWVSPSVKPSQDHNDSLDYDPNYNDLLRGNWRSGSNLSLGIGMSQYEEEIDHHHHHHRHQHDHDKIRGDHVEVDLELRLGYI